MRRAEKNLWMAGYIMLFISFSIYIALVTIKFPSSPEQICKEANGSLFDSPNGKICLKGLNGVDLKEEQE